MEFEPAPRFDPCGYYGDPFKPCTCSSATVTRYQERISGSLLDRIDIHIEVPRVVHEKLNNTRPGNPDGASNNSDMTMAELRKFCVFDETCSNPTRTVSIQFQPSARANHHIPKRKNDTFTILEKWVDLNAQA